MVMLWIRSGDQLRILTVYHFFFDSMVLMFSSIENLYQQSLFSSIQGDARHQCAVPRDPGPRTSQNHVAAVRQPGTEPAQGSAWESWDEVSRSDFEKRITMLEQLVQELRKELDEGKSAAAAAADTAW